MKLFITTIIAVPVLVFGVAFTFLSNLSMEKLVICSTVDESYYFPSKVCRFYLYNYSDDKDFSSLKDRAGLAYAFNIEDNKLKYETIEYLIARGVDVNEISNIDGLTPLNAAVLMNDSELVEFLLDNGARINAQDRANKLNAVDYNSLLKNNNKKIDRSKINNIFREYREKNT